MNMVKRVTAALMAALVIMMTTYEAYTIPVQATGAVVGGVLGDLLADFLVSLGVTYVGYECIDKVTGSGLESSLQLYLNTTEGSLALKEYAKSFTVIEGGGGSEPEPPEDLEPDEILDTKVEGLVMSKQLFDFAAGFFDYVTANNTDIGTAINEASNQEITYAPFPECFHFSSVENPVYNPDSIELIQAKYPAFSLDGNSFIQIYTPFSYDTWMLYPADSTTFLTFRIDRTVCYYSANVVNDAGNLVGTRAANYMRNLQTNEVGYYLRTGSYASWGDLSDLYLCGNVHFDYNNASYELHPDGMIYQVVDGVASVQVKPHLETAEGYLTSAKPIVGTNISGLIDAIGKAIADAYPDQAPVLSPEAINEIYNNVSNYYDQAVSNYYNDTTYLTENEYVTNITNIYEQAITDNPAVDDNPALPISPTLGSLGDYKTVGLSDVFPFCIPFDMYDLMSILVAEPKAVSFDYTFYMGEDLGEYTYTVDLSVFDPVARVVRTMELLIYMYGLMLVTRKLIGA